MMPLKGWAANSEIISGDVTLEFEEGVVFDDETQPPATEPEETGVAGTLPEENTGCQHTSVVADAVEPATCIDVGKTEGSHCSDCGTVITAQTTIAAKGHSYGDWVQVTAPTIQAKGCEQRTCSNCGATETRDIDKLETEHSWDAGVVTKNPTEEAEGIKTYTCTFCGETKIETLDKLPAQTAPSDCSHSYGDWVQVTAPTIEAMGIGQRICAVCGVKETRDIAKLVNVFTDVSNSEYYATPVAWAASEGITAGTSETTFAPNDNCTRAQIVTFLWRFQGKPEPTSTKNPFVDVKESDYYYKAVLWAVEKGITTGTSETTFSPKDNCTRAQAVTFLWRSATKPTPSGKATQFTDLQAGAYYIDAVAWAVENNITNGTSATAFSPEGTCIRGQIVTFLWRYVNGTEVQR